MPPVDLSLGDRYVFPVTTITGARRIDDVSKEDMWSKFDRYVYPFSRSSDTTGWLVGGADGVDTLALQYLVDVVLVRQTALVWVVVPFKLGDQPIEARHMIELALECTGVELVELESTLRGSTRSGAYHARNRWMVDRSDQVVGFPRRDGNSRGTQATLDYATQVRSLPRVICPIGERPTRG